MKILLPKIVPMDSNSKRNWNILNWNVRGLNSVHKSNAIRAKIHESSCAIFCIQERKTQRFESSTIRKFAPKHFNKFSYFPSEGALGGILARWINLIFAGEVIFASKFTFTIQLTTQHNAKTWKLTNVYVPCVGIS
jgi:exonuclease III